MDVNELIKKLSVVKNKKKPVKFFHQNRTGDWLKLPVNDVIDNDDYVLIGDDLPPEIYERDYKY